MKKTSLSGKKVFLPEKIDPDLTLWSEYCIVCQNSVIIERLNFSVKGH